MAFIISKGKKSVARIIGKLQEAEVELSKGQTNVKFVRNWEYRSRLFVVGVRSTEE
jgi:hypothetical protein